MATYDYLKSKNGHKIQVESAKRDGSGKNIENNYAKQNGYYKQLTGGLSDNLTPYSEDSGVHQENPFISNGTGTNNNQEIVTVGDYALVQEKQGNSVVVNQLLSARNQTIERSGITYTYSKNGKITISGTSNDYSFLYLGSAENTNISFLANHKYLYDLNNKGTLTGITINVLDEIVYSWTGIINKSSNGNGRCYVSFDSGQTIDGSISLILIDLTQWFGSNDNIPQDLLDNPSHWSWYQNYGDYITYNTGSLESANGVKLVSTGRNQWDEIIELGGIDTTTGNNKSQSNVIRSKNYISVNPNTTYYFYGPETTTTNMRIFYYDKDKTFIGVSEWYLWNRTRQMPSNCRFIRFIRATSATIYENNITISLYYTPEQGGEGYDKYYPYEEPTIVDTGTETLLSAGSVRDYKEPNGTIHRLVGTRAYQNGDENNSSLLTNGTTTYYPLETPTTEQGTPYPETLPINDYGILYWLDENDNLVGIPQGAKIFFPVNYKGFVDDVYSRTSGDAGNLVIQSELSEYVKQVDLSSQITDVAGLTYQYKKAIKTGNVVTITIQADNSTGNSINAGDTLFKIGSALQPSMNIVCFCRISGANTEVELGASGVSGNCSLGSALSNGASMRFTVSYIVE